MGICLHRPHAPQTAAGVSSADLLAPTFRRVYEGLAHRGLTSATLVRYEGRRSYPFRPQSLLPPLFEECGKTCACDVTKRAMLVAREQLARGPHSVVVLCAVGDEPETQQPLVLKVTRLSRAATAAADRTVAAWLALARLTCAAHLSCTAQLACAASLTRTARLTCAARRPAGRGGGGGSGRASWLQRGGARAARDPAERPRARPLRHRIARLARKPGAAAAGPAQAHMATSPNAHGYSRLPSCPTPYCPTSLLPYSPILPCNPYCRRRRRPCCCSSTCPAATSACCWRGRGRSDRRRQACNPMCPGCNPACPG